MRFLGILPPSDTVDVRFEEVFTTKTGVIVLSECVLNGIPIPHGHCRGGQMNIAMVYALAKVFGPLTQECGRARPNGRWQADNCVVANVALRSSLRSAVWAAELR